MSKKKGWYKKDILIKDLFLWDENARFPEEYFNKSEEELIDHFLKKKNFKIVEFAKEVVDEFDIPQVEKIIVYELNNRYIVLEGNRRLVTYKILFNPNLVKDLNLRKKIDELILNVKLPKNFKLEANVTTDKDEGLRVVSRKHNKSNNEVPWGEVERSNFLVRHSYVVDKKDILKVKISEYVKKASLPQEIKNAVLGKGYVSTFFRVVDSPSAREKLKYYFDDKKEDLVFDDEKTFESLLRVIIFNIWSKKDFQQNILDSRSLNKSVSIENYLKSLKKNDSLKVDREIKENTKENLFGDQIILAPSRGISNQLSSGRKFLINNSIYISDPRINAIYDELRVKLEVDSVPNAVAVLFRVFLECSLDCYIDFYNLKMKEGISGKIITVADHLEGAIVLRRLSENGINQPAKDEFEKEKKKVSFKSIRKLAAKDSTSILSISNFHDYVHDYKTSPISSELKIYWDNLNGFFSSLWQALQSTKSKKKVR